MLVFAITTLLPANVAYLILGPFAPPEQVRALELKLGLNDPVWQQYLRWAGALPARRPRRVDADEPADRAAADGGARPLAGADLASRSC